MEAELEPPRGVRKLCPKKGAYDESPASAYTARSAERSWGRF